MFEVFIINHKNTSTGFDDFIFQLHLCMCQWMSKHWKWIIIFLFFFLLFLMFFLSAIRFICCFLTLDWKQMLPRNTLMIPECFDFTLNTWISSIGWSITSYISSSNLSAFLCLPILGLKPEKWLLLQLFLSK